MHQGDSPHHLFPLAVLPILSAFCGGVITVCTFSCCLQVPLCTSGCYQYFSTNNYLLLAFLCVFLIMWVRPHVTQTINLWLSLKTTYSLKNLFPVTAAVFCCFLHSSFFLCNQSVPRPSLLYLLCLFLAWYGLLSNFPVTVCPRMIPHGWSY